MGTRIREVMTRFWSCSVTVRTDDATLYLLEPGNKVLHKIVSLYQNKKKS